jgi:bifunctional UDP-N-acetylglucosamine pyrophosphorylase/glucosamine-1-phosphate N-acetyltransferase
VRAIAQERINLAHMRAGVTLVDPRSAHIDVGVTIGADTVIEPGCVIQGATAIGEGTTIGAFSTLIDAEVGDGATIRRSHLERARVHAKTSVGPFAYLRPDAVLQEGAKAGTFVEIKNSNIGRGSKVPHLSYIGDADVGEGTNIGAGNITANYDGREKHRTTIGDRVRASVDTMYVAPVTVGDDAYTAAGSVITEDVPDGALGIARQRQTNIEGYAARVSRRER